MILDTWLIFLGTTFFISGSPGPNMLMMMSSSVKHGMRRTLFTMAGCYLSLLVALAASAAGLGALLKVEPLLFNILCYIGAAYLVYLGVQAWRSPASVVIDPDPLTIKSTTPQKIFYEGFMVGISNPKALLFATAFFPQFINQNAPELPQFAILLATFSVVELSWYVAYASGGSKLSEYMRKENVRKIFNRITGALFCMFGIFLLFSKF